MVFQEFRSYRRYLRWQRGKWLVSCIAFFARAFLLYSFLCGHLNVFSLAAHRDYRLPLFQIAFRSYPLAFRSSLSACLFSLFSEQNDTSSANRRRTLTVGHFARIRFFISYSSAASSPHMSNSVGRKWHTPTRLVRPFSYFRFFSIGLHQNRSICTHAFYKR